MLISILLPTIFAIYAFYKKKLTNLAIFICWIFGFIIAYVGDYYAFFALALTFILTLLTDKLKKGKVDYKRDSYQILSNVLTATLCIILLDFTGNNIYYTMFYCVLAASLADTLSSSIGSLSKNKPVNIINFKKVKTGYSGAVSWLGINASLSAGILIGLIYYSAVSDTFNYLIIILMGLSGSLLDSLLGGLFQSQYKCLKCRKIIEEPIHCNQKSNLVKGYKVFDNNLVNLLSNIIVFLISYLILF